MPTLRKHLTWIEWTNIVPIAMLLLGGVWSLSARNSDLITQKERFEESKKELKANIDEVKKTADEARDRVGDVAGDVKVIRALLESVVKQNK